MSGKTNSDDLIRNKLKNFEKAPPPEIWDGIRRGISSRKRIFVPVYFKYAAGLLLFLGTAALLRQIILFEDSLTPISSIEKNEPDPFLLHEPREDHSINKPLEIENISVPEPVELGKAFTPYVDGNSNHRITNDPKNDPLKLTSIPLSVKPDTLADYAENNLFTGHLSYNEMLPKQITPYSPGNGSIAGTGQEKKYSWDDLKPTDFEDHAASAENIFFLGAQFSPIYSYRDVAGTNETLNEFFNESESGKISYSGGFNFGIKAGKRISIHSGIHYSRLGVSVNNILAVAEYRESSSGEIRFEPDAFSPYLVSNSIGSIQSGGTSSKASMDYSSLSPASPSSTISSELNYLNSGGFYAPADNYVEDGGTIDQLFHYLEIPLMLKYKLVDRQVDIGILGGMSSNFLVGNRVIYHQNGNSEIIGSTSDIQTVNYSGNIGVGLNYDFTDQFRFLFEPQLKYYLNSINRSNLISNRPYSVGLYTGFVYLF